MSRFAALTPVERRTVLALHRERNRLVAELQECDEALQEQIAGIVSRQGLPPADYTLEQTGDGQLYLAGAGDAPHPVGEKAD